MILKIIKPERKASGKETRERRKSHFNKGIITFKDLVKLKDKDWDKIIYYEEIRPPGEAGHKAETEIKLSGEGFIHPFCDHGEKEGAEGKSLGVAVSSPGPVDHEEIRGDRAQGNSQ